MGNLRIRGSTTTQLKYFVEELQMTETIKLIHKISITQGKTTITLYVE